MTPHAHGLRARISRIITTLEGYARTDLRYIIRGGTWLTISNVVSSITAFLSSIAFAYFVPQDTFGIYQYILTVVGLLTIVTMPRINDAVSRAVSRGKEGEFRHGLHSRLRWGILASIGALAIAAYYAIKGNAMFATAFVVVAAFVWFFDALGLFIAYLKAKRLFREAVSYKVVGRVVTLGVTVLVIWQTQNLLAIVITYFVTLTVVRTVSHYLVVLRHPPNAEYEPDTLRYGKSLSLLATFKTGVAQLDKILVYHYLGPVELAIYFFATAPVDQVRSAFAALSDLASPKFSQADGSVLRSTLLPKLLRFELVVLIPVVVAYIVVIPYLFPLVFPAYGDYVLYTQIYAFSLLFFPATLLSTALVAQKRERALWVSRILMPLVRLCILIVAVQGWGLIGMTVGVVLVNASDLLINFAAFFWPFGTKGRVNNTVTDTSNPPLDRS